MDLLPPPTDPDQTMPPSWVLQRVPIEGMILGQDHLERALAENLQLTPIQT